MDGGGHWIQAGLPTAQEKRHGVSGPVGDLFFEPTLLVPGTIGTDEETFFNAWLARNARAYFATRNGGVHRGGIMGENSVELATIPDVELSERDLCENNLLCYGTPRSNAVLKRVEGLLSVGFEGNTIYLADKSYAAEQTAVVAVLPNPVSAGHYVAVHGGATPDAIAWGSHLDMMLLPDYLVYSGGDVLDWGFWDHWWLPKG